MKRLAAALAQEGAPQEPPPPGKRWVKVTKIVDGHDVEEWVAMDVPSDEGPTWPARGELALLDGEMRRLDGPDKVTGRARYPHDVRAPGLLWGRLLLCPHPAARSTVDLEPVRAMPGVHAAIAIGDGQTLFLGQPIAAVAADTPERAEDALRAIGVELEERPWVIDLERAAEDDAPRVDPEEPNLSTEREDGDRAAAEAAVEASDARLEGTYSVPHQHHVCLETHGVVVDYRGGDTATVYASTQGTITIAEPAGRALGLGSADVVAVVENMGGGFGSKFGLGVEGQAACELSRAAGRPVHMLVARRDEFLMAGTRSGCTVIARAGATADGRLRGLVAEVRRSGGVLRGPNVPMPYVYSVEHAYRELRSVRTHTDASRAFRAPGHPQASFAMESIVDELAYALAMDPLEFRKRNLEDPVYHRQLDRVAAEIGWADHPHRTAPDTGPSEQRTGIGFGVSTWGSGGRAFCEVDVEIARDGGVRVRTASQDLGTGTLTWVAAVVAEELGLALSAVRAEIGRSDFPRANPSGGSTTVVQLAPAVKVAAWRARRQLFERVAPELGVPAERLVAREGVVADREDPERALPWAEACAVLGDGGLRARGEWQPQLSAQGVHGAQAAKVTVDTLTGEVRVVKMVCVQDLGLALNRTGARSQIQGAMIQSLSYGLLEGRVLDPDLGVQLNGSMTEYKIAGVREIPELVAILDDEDDRPVIGVGEPPVVPGQSAVANAIYNACGVRLRSLPLTPDKVLEGLVSLGIWGGGA